MSLFPVFYRAMRPSSWMEQQLKMMQHLENVVSSSCLRHPSFHVEWDQHELKDGDLLKYAKEAATANKPFKVQLDVKNFSPKQIKVKAVDQNIIVEGKHEEKSDDTGFISRHFIRTYSLPEGCFAEDVQSSLENGVLTITAPNRALPEQETKEIPIQVKDKDEKK